MHEHLLCQFINDENNQWTFQHNEVAILLHELFNIQKMSCKIIADSFPVFLEFRTLSRHMVSDDAGIMEEPPGF